MRILRGMYKSLWEDCGFETYAGKAREYMSSGIDDDPFAPERHRLEMREALELIEDRFYQMEETSTHLRRTDPTKADALMDWGVNKFHLAAAKVWQQCSSGHMRTT
jgi:hypothetical protein